MEDNCMILRICQLVTKKYCHGINSWDYDVSNGRCVAMMASGHDWNDYLGKAVACGFEYLLGTVFRVLEPKSIARTYTCLDCCPACTGKRQLDFLSLSQKLPWNREF